MNKHKDLPPGSQQWANELDEAMKEIGRLTEVVRRLSENAGLDMANPRRGVNGFGEAPSIKGPVGQKLSSLADVGTYDVADGQVLSWSGQGQKWLPVTLPTPSAGGTIDLTGYTYSGLTAGYGETASATKYAYTAAGIKGTDPFDHPYTEVWATDSVYIGAGAWRTAGYSLIEASGDLFGRPYVSISAFDHADGTSATLSVYSFGVRLDGAYFVTLRTSTANRPAGLGTGDQRRGAMVFDTDLNIPIWWNGTTWVNALGTAV